MHDSVYDFKSHFDSRDWFQYCNTQSCCCCVQPFGFDNLIRSAGDACSQLVSIFWHTGLLLLSAGEWSGENFRELGCCSRCHPGVLHQIVRRGAPRFATQMAKHSSRIIRQITKSARANLSRPGPHNVEPSIQHMPFMVEDRHPKTDVSRQTIREWPVNLVL